MFEPILAETDPDTALEAVHAVLRMLRHPGYAARHVRTLRHQLDSGVPQDPVTETTARLIAAIENREDRRIDRLTENRAKRYTVELAELVVARTTRDTAQLRSTGRAVLEGLRRDLAF